MGRPKGSKNKVKRGPGRPAARPAQARRATSYSTPARKARRAAPVARRGRPRKARGYGVQGAATTGYMQADVYSSPAAPAVVDTCFATIATEMLGLNSRVTQNERNTWNLSQQLSSAVTAFNAVTAAFNARLLQLGAAPIEAAPTPAPEDSAEAPAAENGTTAAKPKKAKATPEKANGKAPVKAKARPEPEPEDDDDEEVLENDEPDDEDEDEEEGDEDYIT